MLKSINIKKILTVILFLTQISLNAQEQKKKIVFNYFDAEIQNQLQLTDEQKAKLQHLRNEVIAPKIREMNSANLDAEALKSRKNEINYETRRLYYDVLTKEQKNKYGIIMKEINKKNQENGFD